MLYLNKIAQPKVMALFFNLLAVFFLIPTASAQEQEEVNTVSVFVRDSCQHCQDEKEFLSVLQQESPGINVRYYDLGEPASAELFTRITDRYRLSKATPLTLIRGRLLSGFSSAATTGVVIRQLLAGEGDPSLVFEDIAAGGAKIADSSGAVCDEIEGCSINNSLLVTIPFTGRTINAGRLSLTGLALTLGLIDGFNPCALWVLLMLLVLLTQAGSKKRMWQYAGLFILAEAIMYYLILNVWFTVWDFVALDRIVTPLVGLLAIGSGLYFLYKFKHYQPVCDVTSFDQQQKVAAKAASLVGKPLTLAVALGLIGLAFSVNIFEFACSIGIPQAFTKILEMNPLSYLTRQWFIGLYILMYMIDDFIVFGLALFSFDKIGLTHKYSRWSTLVGGLLMITLGLIMLFSPQWLVI